MKILITGGAGYIGSKLAWRLMNIGYRVTVVDNLTYDHGLLVSPVLLHPNCTFLRTDVSSLEREDVQDFDVVYPLSALVTIPGCEKRPEETIQANLTDIENLMSKLRPSQRIIFTCTNSGYGVGGELACTEETPFAPNSIYGKTKMEAEKVVLRHPGSTSFRLATLHGVSFKPRLDLIVNNFSYQFYTTGKVEIFDPHFRRNVVCIDDVVSCLVWAIGQNQTVREIFNLGCDADNCTKLELAEKIAKHFDNVEVTTSAIGDDIDHRDYLVSNQKLSRAGFTATKTIDQSVPELIRWFETFPRREDTYAASLLDNDRL